LTEAVKLLFWWLHRVCEVRTSLFAQCSQTILRFDKDTKPYRAFNFSFFDSNGAYATLQTFYVIMRSLKGSYNAIIQVNLIL